MKYFWLLVVLFAAVGTAAAWAVNYSRFGSRTSRLDRLVKDEVSAQNVVALAKADYLVSGAKVEMETEERYDFGVMAPGEKGSKIFKIKNVGTDPLTLKVGASTCRCTIGSLKSDTVAPGDSAEILIEWTVKTTKNTFSQNAQIITNDPSKVLIDLHIEGRVVREIEMAPKAWTFGSVATGEGFEFDGKVYSYYEHGIELQQTTYSMEQLNDLAEITVEPFEPGEDDGIYSEAKHGYHVMTKVKPGLRQGAVSTRFLFGFKVLDEDGKVAIAEDGSEGDVYYADAQVTGVVQGSMGVVLNSKIKSTEDGGYIYNFGRLGSDDSKKAKLFIKLKGSERETTNLMIGEVSPEGVIQAKLGKPLVQVNSVLCPLELELVPGDEAIDLTGKSKDDYGYVWIESDNPKVTRMLIAVKFAIDAK
ncbi:MAG: DUF1573 domain-containing protein [Pirellulaceae bacterium]|nr:DUF1573 domain-containing protein [Pirellulaceae bacterium]